MEIDSLVIVSDPRQPHKLSIGLFGPGRYALVYAHPEQTGQIAQAIRLCGGTCRVRPGVTPGVKLFEWTAISTLMQVDDSMFEIAACLAKNKEV